MMVESVTGCSAPRLQHCSTSRYLVPGSGSTGVSPRPGCPGVVPVQPNRLFSRSWQGESVEPHPAAGRTTRPPDRKRTMRYRSRVTAPAAVLIGTTAALTGGNTAYADAQDTDAQDTGAKTGAGPAPETLGDPVFPALGNDGYRVTAYPLDFSY